MGSYSFVCGMSGLPIEYGDKVRILMISTNPYGESEFEHVWYPRTYPVKATYDDYGGFENIEEGPETEVWQEALYHDLIEKGHGPNSYHDVPITKDMSFDLLLNALLVNRIEVDIDKGLSPINMYGTAASLMAKIQSMHAILAAQGRPLPPVIAPPPDPVINPDCADIKGVTEILQLAGLKVATAEHGSGTFYVSEEFPGSVKVRCAFDEKRFTLALNAILPYFAAMITCGTESYADSKEIVVRAHPGKTKQGYSRQMPRERDRDKISQVRLAVIREDVWNAMIDIGKNLSWYSYTDKPNKEEIKNFINVEEAYLPDRLRGYPSGTGLGSHIHLMKKKKASLSDSQIDEFAELCCDMQYINSAIACLGYEWGKSPTGPQDGEWEAHYCLNVALANIALEKVKQKEESEKEFAAKVAARKNDNGDEEIT